MIAIALFRLQTTLRGELRLDANGVLTHSSIHDNLASCFDKLRQHPVELQVSMRSPTDVRTVPSGSRNQSVGLSIRTRTRTDCKCWVDLHPLLSAFTPCYPLKTHQDGPITETVSACMPQTRKGWPLTRLHLESDASPASRAI